MISPEVYIDRFKDMSYEELLIEKARLIQEISNFENSQNSNKDFIISPSPEVRYQCNLEYLSKLCALISKKYGEKL